MKLLRTLKQIDGENVENLFTNIAINIFREAAQLCFHKRIHIDAGKKVFRWHKKIAFIKQ